MNEFVSSNTPNNSVETAISTASQNERIKLIVGWLLTKNLKSHPKLGVFYDHMAEILAEDYDIYDDAIREQVYDQCEINILEEQLNYVEAWLLRSFRRQ